jgi:hypothetical protein
MDGKGVRSADKKAEVSDGDYSLMWLPGAKRVCRDESVGEWFQRKIAGRHTTATIPVGPVGIGPCARPSRCSGSK